MADAYPDGGASAVERALEAGVSHMVMPNVDVSSVAPLLSLHTLFPEATSVARGIHPTEVKTTWRQDLREMIDRFEDTPCVAWGEIGVDFHWTRDNATQQMDAFGEQLDRAFADSLPVIIHSRDALDATLEITGSMGQRLPRLLFHSFTSGPDDARRILEAHPDALFGFNGVVTFKNAREVREAAALVGINRIVLETDSPYLAPVPHRGKTNESSFLPHILRQLADVAGISAEEAERITTANAREFFPLP